MEDTTTCSSLGPVSRREMLRLLGLVTAGGALAGCAPQAAAPTQQVAEPTAAVEQPTSPAPEPTADSSEKTGTFTFAAHNEWEARLELTEEFFERNYPSMTWKHDVTPWDGYWVKLQSQLAAGTAPDILLSHETRAKAFAAKGLLIKLDDYQAANPMPGELDEYVGLEQLRYQGSMYVVPSLFASYVMLYNKDIFDEAGVAYPKDDWNYDDFLELAKQLSDAPDQWGHVLWNDPGWQGDWYPILKAYGGESFNDEDTECLLDSPEAVQTLDYMRENWCSEVVPSPAVAEQGGGALQLLYAGRAAMGYLNPASLERFHEARAEEFNYGIVFLPSGPKGAYTRIGGSQYAIPVGSQNPEVAWELMRWMIGTEEAMQIEHGIHNECQTSRVGLHAKFNAPKAPEVIEMVPNWREVAVEMALQHGIFIRHSKIGSEFSPMLKAEMDALADCSKTAAEVAQIITKKANQMLDEFTE